MATIKELFITSINNAIKSAELITEPDKKAVAYAKIAQSLALTGMIKADTQINSTESVPAKESLKVENSKGKSKAASEETVSIPDKTDEEVIDEAVDKMEEKQEQIQEEVDAEWTEETMAMFANEVQFIVSLNEKFTNDQLSNCVKSFSEGALSSLDDINPLNITGFVSFMKDLIADADK